MYKGPGVRRRVAWTKDMDAKVFSGGRSWCTMNVDNSRGLVCPVCVLLFILPAVESLVKILSTESEMIPLNPGQSNKKKPHTPTWGGSPLKSQQRRS